MARFTSLFSVLVVLAGAGCAPPAASPDAALSPDAPLMADAARAAFVCGAETCGGDQLCRVRGGGLDAGPPDSGADAGPPRAPGACVPRPVSCDELVDCMGGDGPGNCEAAGLTGCIAEVCYGIDADYTRQMARWSTVSGGGLHVYCPAS